MAWYGSDGPTARVHWFNPENDIALGRDDAHFTPPKAAIELRESGAALPLWYGAEADYAIGAPPPESWAEEMHEAFGIDARRLTPAPPLWGVPQPWGWSDYSRAFFAKCGYDASLLPCEDATAKMRSLSHRRTAALIARRLRDALPDANLAPEAVECATIQDVKAYLRSHPSAYLKSPWSSSGRGVMCTEGRSEEAVMQFAAGSIRHQGSVMAECAYCRTLDFAQLFESKDGKIKHLGTSVFDTSDGGMYIGNILAPEAERFAIAAAHAGADTLLRVREHLLCILQEEVAPHYEGVLGVDMLVDRSGMLDAAVELNLRTTMGYVAARFYDRFMVPGARGVFRIGGFGAPKRYRADSGKLVEGTLRLNPSGRFGFEATVSEAGSQG